MLMYLKKLMKFLYFPSSLNWLSIFKMFPNQFDMLDKLSRLVFCEQDYIETLQSLPKTKFLALFQSKHVRSVVVSNILF